MVAVFLGDRQAVLDLRCGDVWAGCFVPITLRQRPQVFQRAGVNWRLLRRSPTKMLSRCVGVGILPGLRASLVRDGSFAT